MNDNVRHIFGEPVVTHDSVEHVDSSMEQLRGGLSAALVLGIDKDTGLLRVSVAGLDVPQAMWLMEQFKFAILETNVPENLGVDNDPAA